MNQQQLDTLIFVCSSAASVILLFFAAYFTFMEIRYKRTFYQKCSNQLRLIRQEVLALPSAASAPSRAVAVKGNLTAKQMLNKDEKQFFKMLTQGLPDHHVFPQVSFNALVTHAPHVKNHRWERSIRRKFNTKYVDFVVCDKTDMQVVAIAEYDGGGHRNHNDAHRDELLKSVGYRVERFTPSDTMDSVQARFGKLYTPQLQQAYV